MNAPPILALVRSTCPTDLLPVNTGGKTLRVQLRKQAQSPSQQALCQARASVGREGLCHRAPHVTSFWVLLRNFPVKTGLRNWTEERRVTTSEVWDKVSLAWGSRRMVGRGTGPEEAMGGAKLPEVGFGEGYGARGLEQVKVTTRVEGQGRVGRRWAGGRGGIPRAV